MRFLGYRDGVCVREVPSAPSPPRFWHHLAPLERDRFMFSQVQTEKRMEVEDLNDLNNAFTEGSWVCSYCDQVNQAEELLCGNIIEGDIVEAEGDEDDEENNGPTYTMCRGSQAHTWAGYVRGADIRPVINPRERDPNWRGRFSGGSRSQRHRARLSLTEAEEAGRFEGSDPVRSAEVETAIAARRQLKEARRRQTEARYIRKRVALEGDPYKWPCSYCYKEQDVGNWLYQDLMNFGTSAQCYKCSRPRPREGSAESEDVQL